MTAPVSPTRSPKQELARRELARRRLLQFTRQSHPRYKAGWVHDDICRRLERFSQQVALEQSPRLMLLMPPRHGKSELASIRFPAWHLGHHPEHEIINVGYNLDLPMIFSRKVREILREPDYNAIFPGAVLDPESQGATAWKTTAGGGFTPAGVGGGITGKGAHILVVDDPIKNQEEADSILIRDALEGWYQSTAYTRLAPGGGVLIIETWWNDDDLAGRLQSLARRDPLADKFEVVKYPALAEKYEYRDTNTLEIVNSDMPLHTPDEDLVFDTAHKMGSRASIFTGDGLELIRRPGDCLHFQRYDETALARYKANLNPRIWSALYQQNPVPDEGMYFKKEYFRYAPAMPDLRQCYLYTAWDWAVGVKTHNDWTVGVTIAQDSQDNLYVLEVMRMKVDSFGIADAVADVAARYSTIYGAPYTLGVEDGQIWKAIEPIVKKRFSERSVFPVTEVMKPLTDKLARGRPLQGRFAAGKVFFPEDAPWRKEVETELLRFPAGAHDDIVDALAWVAQLVVRKDPPKLYVPPAPRSWRDKLTGVDGVDASAMAA